MQTLKHMNTNINLDSRHLVSATAVWKLSDLILTLFVVSALSVAGYVVFFAPVPVKTQRFLYLHDVCRSTTNLTTEQCARQVRMQLYRETHK